MIRRALYGLLDNFASDYSAEPSRTRLLKAAGCKNNKKEIAVVESGVNLAVNGTTRPLTGIYAECEGKHPEEEGKRQSGAQQDHVAHHLEGVLQGRAARLKAHLVRCALHRKAKKQKMARIKKLVTFHFRRRLFALAHISRCSKVK